MFGVFCHVRVCGGRELRVKLVEGTHVNRRNLASHILHRNILHLPIGSQRPASSYRHSVAFM